MTWLFFDVLCSINWVEEKRLSEYTRNFMEAVLENDWWKSDDYFNRCIEARHFF